MTAERVLDEIIALEKSLQEQVEQEKERIRSWQEQERGRLQPKVQGTDRQQTAKVEEILEEARREGAQQVARRRETAREEGARFAALNDDFLCELLKSSLRKLLPEKRDDRPDGQG